MIPYLILLTFFVILGAFTFSKEFDDKYDLVKTIVLSSLILFAGLASSRGDFLQYIEAYNDGFGPTFEPAINIIGKIYKSLGFSIYILFLTFAAIGISLKISFFNLVSNKYFFIILVSYISAYYVSCEMGAIRFGAAMGFTLYNIKNIEEKKFKNFLFLILIGALFHASILLTLPLFYLRWKAKIQKLIPTVIIVALLFSLVDFELLLDQLFDNYFPEAIILVKYSTYFHEPAYVTPALIKRVLFFLSLSFFYDKLTEKQKWFKTMYLMYFLSITSFIFFKANHTAASRLSFLFSVAEPVLFASFLLLTNNKKYQLIITSFILLYAYINLSTSLLSQNDEYNKYLPYKFFFQQ